MSRLAHSMPTDSELLSLQRTIYKSSNPTRRWLHETRMKWIARKLQALSRHGGSSAVLEVGTGSGVYIPMLARLFDRVVVVETEPLFLRNAREVARGLTNVVVVGDDITSPHLEDGDFDVVLCSEVIEHIREYDKALHNIRRFLKPEGHLVLSLPQRFSVVEVVTRVAFLPWVIDLVKLVYKEPLLDPGHINLMSKSKLWRSLEAVGFEVVETYRSGLYLPVLAECGGRTAVDIEQWIESRIRDGILGWLLWTQYYVARLPARDGAAVPRESEA